MVTLKVVLPSAGSLGITSRRRAWAAGRAPKDAPMKTMLWDMVFYASSSSLTVLDVGVRNFTEVKEEILLLG